jgi:hypothetical protein
MGDLSTPPYTKRITRGACQALLPNRLMESLLHTPWDLWSSSHAPLPRQGCAKPGIHKHLWSLPCHTPSRPAQPCRSSVLLGCGPQPCRPLLCLPCPQGLHNPEQYSLYKPVPLRPAKPGTHTPTISILRPGPPSLSSQGSIHMQDLHSTDLCPSGTPSPCSKGPLLHLS